MTIENELEKYGVEEKKWDSLVDNLGLPVNKIIWAIQTACVYNGLYEVFEDWIVYGDNIVAEEKKKHNKFYNISCPLDVEPFRNCGEEIDEYDYWPDKSKDHVPMSPMWRAAWYDEFDTYYHKSGALKYPDFFMELVKVLKELKK